MRRFSSRIVAGHLAGIVVVVAGLLAAGGTAHGQSDPIAALAGQQTQACNYNADLDVTVVWTDATAVLVGTPAPAGQIWAVLIIDVTNVSDKVEALTSRPLELRDDRGRTFEVSEDPPDVADVAAAYEVLSPWYEFVPGITERSVVTFLVPRDVAALTLVGRRDYC